MYRKTPSSEKNASLLQEIRQEFLGTFSKEEERATTFMTRYPKQIFIGMVILIILSSILAFVYTPLTYDKEFPEELSFGSANEIKENVSGEISTILDLSDRVKRISLLKAEVERIIQLDVISYKDSVFLENAIQELEYFNNHKKKDNEN